MIKKYKSSTLRFVCKFLWRGYCDGAKRRCPFKPHLTPFFNSQQSQWMFQWTPRWPIRARVYEPTGFRPISFDRMRHFLFNYPISMAGMYPRPIVRRYANEAVGSGGVARRLTGAVVHCSQYHWDSGRGWDYNTQRALGGRRLRTVPTLPLHSWAPSESEKNCISQKAGLMDGAELETPQCIHDSATVSTVNLQKQRLHLLYSPCSTVQRLGY